MSSVGQYLSREQLQQLRGLSAWRGLGAVAWSWGWIAACFAAYAAYPTVWTALAGVIIISGRHLAVAILMHEAAHGLLCKNRRLNDFVGEWLLAYPTFTKMAVYRQIHFQHHKNTGTDADPDLGLVKPFPITRQSMRRKVIRDLTGQTALRRYVFIARLSAGLSPAGSGLEGNSLLSVLRQFVRNQYGFLITNALLLIALTLVGIPEAFLLLWWLPAWTGYSLVLRIRSIAEHAMVRDPSTALGQTRTTLAGPLTRFLIAPHHVNYHLEHHLFMFVPHYRLPLAHRMLKEAGHLDEAEIATGYREVLKLATSKVDDLAAASPA